MSEQASDIRFADLAQIKGSGFLSKTKGDKVIWAIVLLLVLVSLLAVYSATGSLAYKMYRGNTEVYLFEHPSDEFVKRYQDRFKKAPGIFADTAYDALIAMAKAVDKAGNDDPEKVSESLLEVQLNGSGRLPITFTDQGLQNKSIVLHRVHLGKIVPIDPKK